MSNRHFDFTNTSQHTDTARSNDLSKNTFYLQAEGFEPPVDNTSNIRCSEKEVMYMLGLMATLIVLFGFQLHRCLDTQPINESIVNESAVVRVK